MISDQNLLQDIMKEKMNTTIQDFFKRIDSNESMGTESYEENMNQLKRQTTQKHCELTLDAKKKLEKKIEDFEKNYIKNYI